jgi:flavorubredoxin
MKLSEYLNAINYTKKNLFDTEDESVEKEYAPFVVNRCLSYFIDTVLYVNEVNQRGHMPKRMQFDYLHGSIRKNKRYSKWLRRESEENLDLVKRMYGYSDSKARAIMDILSESDFDWMREKVNEGGESRK